ncbi:hypothetical protein [Burkholderia seminalis]|uniref:hypothetical protein n=1 Tax=Burkholderia seminalis TaxID=488731 RepID=UPI0026517CDC|nr:hypothetical protein [Burkholderia seminalis]MDN7586625.1 hypothetical protein [Burkholderia seminalis]
MNLVWRPLRDLLRQLSLLSVTESGQLDYSGNNGVTRLDSTGATNWRGNFMIRTARFWIDKGFAVVLTDAPSDRQSDGTDDCYRRSADALIDQRFIIEEVRKRFPQSKIALISTSRGTVTVGNVLEHAPELSDLYVLTSPRIGRNAPSGHRRSGCAGGLYGTGAGRFQPA